VVSTLGPSFRDYGTKVPTLWDKVPTLWGQGYGPRLKNNTSSNLGSSNFYSYHFETSKIRTRIILRRIKIRTYHFEMSKIRTRIILIRVEIRRFSCESSEIHNY
jgi:hypothetical protein